MYNIDFFSFIYREFRKIVKTPLYRTFTMYDDEFLFIYVPATYYNC